MQVKRLYMPRRANSSGFEWVTIYGMEKIYLKTISDHRGSLVSIESEKSIPWNIKRVYYMYDLNDEPRGFHAHKKLRQFFICLNGSCDVKLDNGNQTTVISLSSPNEGLFIDQMIWHEMHNFSKDCVILVLAEDYYDESDYIRDYAQFKIQFSKKDNF